MEQDNVSVTSNSTEFESDSVSIASNDTYYQYEIENEEREYENDREQFYDQALEYDENDEFE